MSSLSKLSDKIVGRQRLTELLADWSRNHKKIVFTNGCFDLLHLGHVDYLSKAADLGDILVIGLNSDQSVRRIKGNSRPITDEKSRSVLLAAMEFVSAVVIFDEDTPYELIRMVNPDILVKGSDYKPEDVVGHDIVEAKGGKVITIDFLDGYSTSSIEKKILENHSKKNQAL
jgi:rfaE bifunctional protein nucleotidyltransferase chain/domain